MASIEMPAHTDDGMVQFWLVSIELVRRSSDNRVSVGLLRSAIRSTVLLRTDAYPAIVLLRLPHDAERGGLLSVRRLLRWRLSAPRLVKWFAFILLPSRLANRALTPMADEMDDASVPSHPCGEYDDDEKAPRQLNSSVYDNPQIHSHRLRCLYEYPMHRLVVDGSFVTMRV